MADRLQKVRSWYGLGGEIGVENQLWHLVKVGGAPLPHPPFVNWILRAELPREEQLQLSFQHEFGPSLSIPIALLYAAWLFLLKLEW